MHKPNHNATRGRGREKGIQSMVLRIRLYAAAPRGTATPGAPARYGNGKRLPLDRPARILPRLRPHEGSSLVRVCMER